MCISSERSECKDVGTAALQEKARFPYLVQRGDTAAAVTQDVKYPSTTLLPNVISMNRQLSVY